MQEAAEERRTAMIVVRTTPANKAIVERAAKADGRTTSNWGEQVLLRAANGETQAQQDPTAGPNGQRPPQDA